MGWWSSWKMPSWGEWLSWGMGGDHTRPELPTWAVHWMHGDDEERKDQLDELFQYYMVPFTLIEMEILDDHGISSGRALVRVIEAKVTASQHAAKVWFLASTETQFDDWANLHFNDLKDFDLHFCRRHPSGCKVKPRSSKLGWYHVGVFRLITAAKAVEQGYMKEAVIEQLGDHLTAYMEEKEVSHREEVQALAEQRREDAVRTTSAKFKAKQKEDLETRTRRVPEEPKGSPPRKAIKLPKATEDQKKAERADAARRPVRMQMLRQRLYQGDSLICWSLLQSLSGRGEISEKRWLRMTGEPLVWVLLWWPWGHLPR